MSGNKTLPRTPFLRNRPHATLTSCSYGDSNGSVSSVHYTVVGITATIATYHGLAGRAATPDKGQVLPSFLTEISSGAGLLTVGTLTFRSRERLRCSVKIPPKGCLVLVTT